MRMLFLERARTRAKLLIEISHVAAAIVENRDSIVPTSGMVEEANVRRWDAEDGAMANTEHVYNMLQNENESSKFFHESGWKSLAVSRGTWAPETRLASQIARLT